MIRSRGLRLRPSVRAGVVALDLAYMGINFSALTLFSILAPFIMRVTEVSSSTIQWGAIAYSAGIFLAFFVGHSKFSERRPAATVLMAAALASIPQFAIPAVPNMPYCWRASTLIGLRLMQGLVMMAVPILSGQVGKLFSSARPFALGVILSGIFVGGFIGSSLGPALTSMVGWRLTYVIFGLMMLTIGGAWVALTPRDTLPVSEGSVKEVPASRVWKEPFTWVWGFTFFPAIWIIFTLAPLISFIVEAEAPQAGTEASRVLEASYMFWSVVMGLVAYLVAKSSSGSRRGLFRSFASVQAFCFAASLAGALMLYLSKSLQTLMWSLILIGVIQGTAPTFWSMQSTAYRKEEVTKAGYALGLLANSAALIGPSLTLTLTPPGSPYLWVLVIGLAAAGLIITAASLKMKLPAEKVEIG
ncbi:MAG: MFS transporter [Desulfurococcales archaeon]|nr:MFS transporter [Desulfurococcales archaeon]